MFILDDILLFPMRSIYWLACKIHDAAQEEMVGDVESITQQLSELYMMLETGQISESEFDAREKELLDRLDQIKGRDK